MTARGQAITGDDDDDDDDDEVWDWAVILQIAVLQFMV